MKKIISLIILASITGCATRSNNIQAAYTSPLQYQSYSCQQVGEELSRVGRKVSEVSGQQDRTATKDTVAMTVGLVVFWPALFFLPGGDHKEELAILKGQHEALQDAAIKKECSAVLAGIEAGKQQAKVASSPTTPAKDPLNP